ncbi:hypothetical protein LCGC14_0683780 [marine sediment metagenome]|uniref:Uncharacterized protein n=1 Tax=marine sediment metagenome TaxID=412755 RepID=A0A0F9R7U3_9ZZZZ
MGVNYITLHGAGWRKIRFEDVDRVLTEYRKAKREGKDIVFVHKGVIRDVNNHPRACTRTVSS